MTIGRGKEWDWEMDLGLDRGFGKLWKADNGRYLEIQNDDSKVLIVWCS